jgi:hypothetical protein
LFANKILDINRDKFFSIHRKNGNNGTLQIENAYEWIQDKYEDIIEDQAAKSAYRRTRAQNRGRWVGGGFGIEGAVKAGVLNAGSGIMHGAANIVGNTFSARSRNQKDNAVHE